MPKKSITAKEILQSAEKVIPDALISYLFKNANRLKTETACFLAAFLSTIAIMLAFAYMLFIYEPTLLINDSGETLWIVLLIRIIIFIPLLILAAFFGINTVKIKTRYEKILIVALVLQGLQGFITSNNKSDFLMKLAEFLLGKK